MAAYHTVNISAESEKSSRSGLVFIRRKISLISRNGYLKPEALKVGHKKM